MFWIAVSLFIIKRFFSKKVENFLKLENMAKLCDRKAIHVGVSTC